MYHYNKQRTRGTVTSGAREVQQQSNLFGPQFSLQASATGVAERPVKAFNRPSNDSANNIYRKYAQPSELKLEVFYQPKPVEPFKGIPGISYGIHDKSNSQNRNANPTKKPIVPSAAYAHDLTNSEVDDTGSLRQVQSAGNNRKAPVYLPGDRVIFAESPSAPGIPIVYRSPEERAANPDRLNLDRRRLTVCPILEGEDQLRLLNYQHNMICQIQHLSGLRRLIFLDLYDNQIEEITGLSSLKSLRVLMLGKNKIKKIENLDTLVKLDVLDLHGNLISVIENMSHLSELRVLNLAGNLIECVTQLAGMDALAELNLRRNQIKTVVDVENLPNLQRLFLSFNEIASFEDVSCLSECNGLTEVALDGNPFAQESSYKQSMIRHMPQLKQLDMKRISDEERRIAHVMARKEEEKKKLLNKDSIMKEKRRLAISNAKRQWEVMQGSLMNRTNKLVKMPDLYASHVGSYSHSDITRDSPENREDGESVSSIALGSISRPGSGRSSRPTSAQTPREAKWTKKFDGLITQPDQPASRPTSARSITNGTTPRERRRERPNTATKQTSRSSSRNSVNRTASPEKETITYSSMGSDGTSMCHLAELENDTLSLYGSGALEALDRNWGIQAAGAVTTVLFKFIDFEDIIKHLGKLRSRFPSVMTLIFCSNNISSLKQINALSTVRRLDNLVIEPEGNPITQFSLWKMYTLFRLAHFSMKKINDMEVTPADIVNAEKFFGSLSHITTSQLSQTRLLTIFGETKKKQILAISEEKNRTKSPDGKVSDIKNASESISRAGLTHLAYDEQCKKDEELQSKKQYAKTYVSQLAKEAVIMDRKQATLRQVWPHLLVELIQSAVIDMADKKSYMKKTMEELEKG